MYCSLKLHSVTQTCALLHIPVRKNLLAWRECPFGSKATYEKLQQDVGFPCRIWLWSQPGRQDLALPEQTKYLQTRYACLHTFLHSRRRRASQHANEISTLGGYRHPGRARF